MKQVRSLLIRHIVLKPSRSVRGSRAFGYGGVTAMLVLAACGNLGIELGDDAESHANNGENGGGAAGKYEREEPRRSERKEQGIPAERPDAGMARTVDASVSPDAGELTDAGRDAGRDTGTDSPSDLPDSGRRESLACAPDCSCEEGGNCSLQCADDSCQVQCAADSTCEIAVDKALRVDLECGAGAICTATAPIGENVQYTCSEGGKCVVDCQGAESCSMLCGGTSNCELHCGDTDACSIQCGQASSCLVLRDNPLTQIEVSCNAQSTETDCQDPNSAGCSAECVVATSPN